MADNTPLSSLVDPPLAPAPRIGDLQDRVRRIQRRRWAVRGTGATAVIVAVVAGLVSLTSGEPRTTVRTASPPPSTGAATAAVPPMTTLGAPRDVVLDTFEVAGKTWQLVGTEENGGICLLVRSGEELANGLCWPADSKLAAVAADTGGTSYVFGIAANEVVLVSHGPNRPAALVPFVGPQPSRFSAHILGKVMPSNVESVTLTAATATDPQAYSQNVALPIHRRVASINGQAVAPTTTIPLNAPGSVPPRPPATEPSPTTTVARPPATTTPPPPIGGQPKQVQPNPAATNLRPTRFESATGADTATIAVRFWGGNENCDVLGRVDVEETATTVTIRLWTGWPPSYNGGPCTAEALQKQVLVSLSSPLAGRTIVDGNA